jgi:hypothetical protein
LADFDGSAVTPQFKEQLLIRVGPNLGQIQYFRLLG